MRGCINFVIKYCFKQISQVIMLVAFVAFAFLVVMLSFSGSGDSNQLNVVVHDLDQTAITAVLIDEISTQATVVETGSEDQLQKQLLSGKIQYIIEIPQGFTAAIIESTPKVVTTKIDGTNSTVIIDTAINQFINRAKASLSLASTPEELAQIVTASHEGAVQVSSTSLAVNDGMEKAATAFPIIGYAFSAAFIGFVMNFLVEQRKSGIDDRIKLTATTARGYISGIMIGYVIVGVIITALTLLAANLIIGIPLNFWLFIYLLLLSYVFMALGLAAGSISKDGLSSMIFVQTASLLIAIAGGFFVPYKMLPEAIRTVGYFLPGYWYTSAITETVKTGLPNFLSIGVLILFIILLSLLAMLLRNRKQMQTY
ncbi:ABC transporter permease [Culicoidibacter larvae]|uniref:ABC transporter permease n=1 Tax=Culicoidibacter larvae TaxID=2579976 RepID=A0A5R8QFR2_9FIRM|nr:ABC transporter permease [Culicoidibacter larvae]TLG76576.1 ABC transporter permease [Culicoidibacter larvae]